MAAAVRGCSLMADSQILMALAMAVNSSRPRKLLASRPASTALPSSNNQAMSSGRSTRGRLPSSRPSHFPATSCQAETGVDSSRVMRPLRISSAKLPMPCRGMSTSSIRVVEDRVGVTTMSMMPRGLLPATSSGRIFRYTSSCRKSSQARMNWTAANAIQLLALV